MQSREYYQALIRFIDFASGQGRKPILWSKCEEIAGEYWYPIFKKLKSDGIASTCFSDVPSIHIFDPKWLVSVRADACHALDILDKQDADRNLENQTKIESLAYARNAYLLSEKTARWGKRHILITGAVALGQLIQWIIMIVQALSSP